MSINLFLFIISSVLMSILFTFKPLEIKQQKFVDVPQFSLSSFTMYEIDKKGLQTLMNGTKGTKYSNRYEVASIDYTDNSKKFLANMKANNGIYKNEFVTLTGDVVYTREDGLTFESNKATYNKKTGISRSDGEYVLFQNKNKVIGKKLVYNNIKDTIKSKEVTVKYQLDEGKK